MHWLLLIWRHVSSCHRKTCICCFLFRHKYFFAEEQRCRYSFCIFMLFRSILEQKNAVACLFYLFISLQAYYNFLIVYFFYYFWWLKRRATMICCCYSWCDEKMVYTKEVKKKLRPFFAKPLWISINGFDFGTFVKLGSHAKSKGDCNNF